VVRSRHLEPRQLGSPDCAVCGQPVGVRTPLVPPPKEAATYLRRCGLHKDGDVVLAIRKHTVLCCCERCTLHCYACLFKYLQTVASTGGSQQTACSDSSRTAHEHCVTLLVACLRAHSLRIHFHPVLTQKPRQVNDYNTHTCTRHCYACLFKYLQNYTTIDGSQHAAQTACSSSRTAHAH
jgi:hypothetical protein